MSAELTGDEFQIALGKTQQLRKIGQQSRVGRSLGRRGFDAYPHSITVQTDQLSTRRSRNYVHRQDQPCFVLTQRQCKGHSAKCQPGSTIRVAQKIRLTNSR